LRLAVNKLDQARVELVRGEKLAGLGSLVAGVSHELNTPIGNTAVAASTLAHHVNAFHQQVDAGNLRKSDLQVFLTRCAEGAELIVSSSQRAAELVASFKQVAVDQTSDRRRTFALDEVIKDVLRSMRPSFKGRDWTIDRDIAQGILCDGYPGPLGQVISNLVQNAVFHGFRDRTSGSIQIAARLQDGAQVQITVRDDGHGIPPEALKKIFDPFFTTRLGQGGSGLGLTIVHNLVTVMLGGRIEVESAVGQGTCFTLTLPLTVPQTVSSDANPA
jgi:signal transduction histidine kinase